MEVAVINIGGYETLFAFRMAKRCKLWYACMSILPVGDQDLIMRYDLKLHSIQV